MRSNKHSFVMKSSNLLLIAFLSFTIIGCSKDTEAVVDVTKPVKTMAVHTEERIVELSYIGIVEAEDIKKLSFGTGGLVEKIYVKRHDTIRPGQLLATVSTKDLQFAVREAKAQVDLANAQYRLALQGAANEDVNQALLAIQKAEDAYEYTLTQLERMRSLYEQGAIPKVELEKMEFEFNLRSTEKAQAEAQLKKVENAIRIEEKEALLAQLERAQVDYEYKSSMLKDAEIRSQSGGYVLDIVAKEGERVGAGHPVILIQNTNQVVTVGVTNRDLQKIKPGLDVSVNANGVHTSGKVISIAANPDPTTRTYAVKVQLQQEQDAYAIGTVVQVKFAIGKEKGIWIPISSIMAEASDYVYTVDRDIAYKTDVVLGAVMGNEIKVEGLEDGALLVIEGAKRLSHQEQVKLQQ